MTDAGRAALERAIGDVATAGRLLVALDFDGTLAPLVDDPAASRALPDAVAAVAALQSLPETVVAVISGRALESLDEVAEFPPGLLMVGSHGAQLRLADGVSRSALTPDDAARRDRLGALLAGLQLPQGVWLEEKPTGVAVHTRLVAESEEARAHESAQRAVAAAGIPGITARSGKKVLEFSVVSANKGDAIDRLREISEADAVVFAGDDVTDEDGFTRLRAGDFGLKCGPGDTSANHRVSDPQAVAAVLHQLASVRREVLERSGRMR